MKKEWHNIVQSSKVADHMNSMYGDYGRFTVPMAGIVKFQGAFVDSVLNAEIDMYLTGYVAGLDEHVQFHALAELIVIAHDIEKAHIPHDVLKMAKELLK